MNGETCAINLIPKVTYFEYCIDFLLFHMPMIRQDLGQLPPRQERGLIVLLQRTRWYEGLHSNQCDGSQYSTVQKPSN